MTKIKMAYEIIQVMIFLGIPTEKFSEMKEKAGSLENLYKVMESKLS